MSTLRRRVNVTLSPKKLVIHANKNNMFDGCGWNAGCMPGSHAKDVQPWMRRVASLLCTLRSSRFARYPEQRGANAAANSNLHRKLIPALVIAIEFVETDYWRGLVKGYACCTVASSLCRNFERETCSIHFKLQLFGVNLLSRVVIWMFDEVKRNYRVNWFWRGVFRCKLVIKDNSEIIIR